MQYIHVKVIAGARKESFSPRLSRTGQAKLADHFEVSVREKAERNMANTRVLALVAEHFSVPISKVRIVNGHHHPSKLLVVE